MNNTLTTVKEWQKAISKQVKQLDKKDSFYLKIPKEQIGRSLKNHTIMITIKQIGEHWYERCPNDGCARCEGWGWHRLPDPTPEEIETARLNAQAKEDAYKDAIELSINK